MRTIKPIATPECCGAQPQPSSSWRHFVSRFLRPLSGVYLHFNGVLCASFFLFLSLCLANFAEGQTIKFGGIVAPASETLRHDPNPFYIFGSHVRFVFPKEAVGKKNKVIIKNLKLSKESTQEIQHVIDQDVNSRSIANAQQSKLLKVSPAGVEVALIKFRQLMSMLTESAPVPFCCHGMPFAAEHPFVPTLECPYPNALRRYFWNPKNVLPTGGSQQPPQTQSEQVPTYEGEEIYVRPVALDGTPEAEEETTFVVRDSDIYFLVTANCGPLSDLTYSGEIEVSNAYGMLPGYRYSGFVCDLICVVAYAVLALIWGICLLRQRKNLIPFHYCLAAVAVLGLLESAAELWSLYQWNLHGPSKIPLCISIGLSVLKNISAYVVVLLGALGWSITRPTLEKTTVYKIQLIVFTYIIFDSLRQVSNAYDSTGTFSLVRSLIILLPISILNVIVFYWIFSALHENIELLTREKQYEKLLIYRRLFIVLFGGIFLATGILILQLYAAALNPSDRWQHQAVLVDGLPRLLFMLLVLSMMLIWRPHIHSRRLAYFTEIGDSDEADSHPRHRGKKTASGPQMWGEELDFHDHFSDEDFEEDGALHLRLENDIPTFASLQVAYPAPGASSSDKKSAHAASSSSSKSTGKEQHGAEGGAAQAEAEIEMGANGFTLGTPSGHNIPNYETQVIGRPAFIQLEENADANPTEIPENAQKANEETQGK